MAALWRITRVDYSLSEQAGVVFERWRDWAAFDRAVFSGSSLPARPFSVLAQSHEASPASGESFGCFDLQLIRVANGAAERARRVLGEGRLPAYRAEGATQTFLFDIVHGDDLPALALFCEWPDTATAFNAYLTVELKFDPPDGLSPILHTSRFLASRCTVFET